MSGHTPGPWVADISDGWIRRANDERTNTPDLTIARMRATCVTGEWEADARLIAAAPEMYEFICRLVGIDELMRADRAVALALLVKIDGPQ